MRLRSVLGEALLNVLTGTTRAGVFGLALTVSLVALCSADAVTVASVQGQVATFRQGGGSTLVYRLDQGVDPVSCDNLASVPGVTAAGALRQRDRGLVAVALPDEPIPTFDISAGFGGFRSLGSVQADGGVLVSKDVAPTLGDSTGNDLELEGGRPRIGGVFPYPSDGRRPGLGYSVLTPADSSRAYDECWVEAWPVTEALLSTLPTVLRDGAGATGGPGPQLQQLNAAHGTRLESEGAFEDRITRFAPAAAAFIGAALGFISIRRRRLEVASALHAGVGAVGQRLQLVIETAIWAALAAVISFSAAAAVAFATAARGFEQTGVSAPCITLAGTSAAVLGALLAALAIKERHLFALFKVRH
ncbi:MAG: hypothetical protein AAGC66_16730 [Leifsonia sp.]